MDSVQMQPRIYLAYDGSINADWVSRYAIRLAAHQATRELFLVHIPDGSHPIEEVRLRIKAIEGECSFHNITLHCDIVPLKGDVFTTLVRTIPAGLEIFCICGARITSRRGGFLKNTISEKLLGTKRFNVMALRVVQPGLLGWADDLLFPLAGHPRGFHAAMPFFHLLAPAIRRFYLLRIMAVSQLARRYMSPEKSRSLYQRGIDYVRQVADEIVREIETGGEEDIRLDMRVVISSDWAGEILDHASELKTQLILIGASDRSFPSNYLQAARIEEILRKAPCDVAIYRTI